MGLKAAHGFKKSGLLAAARRSQAPERFDFVQKSQRHFSQRVQPAIKRYFVQQSPRVHSNRRRNIFCSPNRGTHSLPPEIKSSLPQQLSEKRHGALISGLAEHANRLLPHGHLWMAARRAN